jgi:hypothetical protein
MLQYTFFWFDLKDEIQLTHIFTVTGKHINFREDIPLLIASHL